MNAKIWFGSVNSNFHFEDWFHEWLINITNVYSTWVSNIGFSKFSISYTVYYKEIHVVWDSRNVKKKGICNLHRICNYDSIENYVVTVSCLFHMWDIRFISIRNSGISWHLYNKCVIVAYILLCKFNFFRKRINISFVTCFRILLMIHPNSLYIFMLVLS